MNANKTAYRIKVSTPVGDAYLVCVSYTLDSKPSNYGLDFYELWCPSDLPTYSIPSHRQATFKEELRFLHRASCTRCADGEAEDQFIVKQIRTVYGNNLPVAMSVIDQSMQTSGF